MTLNQTPFDWNVPVPIINSLLIKPALEPNNVLTSDFYVKRIVKTETTLNYLDRPKKFLQKNDDCDFNPKGKMTLSQRKLKVERLKVEMKHCNAEFFDTALEELLGTGVDIFGMFDNPATAAQGLKLLKDQMIKQIGLAVISDWNLLGWLGDESSADEFFGLQDGIIRKLDVAFANGEVKRLNAGSGAALAANSAVELFNELIAKSPLQLRQLPKSQKRFTVTQDILDNYESYLKALGTEQANQLIIDGVPVGITYDGIKIIPKAELDEEWNTDVTQKRFAMLSAEGNLWAGTDITSNEVSLRIYQDVHMKNWFVQGAMKFGVQFAHKELLIYAK